MKKQSGFLRRLTALALALCMLAALTTEIFAVKNATYSTSAGTKSTNKQISVATVYKGNIIKNLIMDCQSYTKYRPNETTGGIFVSWRRKEELPTGA